MARKCGECLIERVDIVELDDRGVCPKCGADYGPAPADPPKPKQPKPKKGGA